MPPTNQPTSQHQVGIPKGRKFSTNRAELAAVWRRLRAVVVKLINLVPNQGRLGIATHSPISQPTNRQHQGRHRQRGQVQRESAWCLPLLGCVCMHAVTARPRNLVPKGGRVGIGTNQPNKQPSAPRSTLPRGRKFSTNSARMAAARLRPHAVLVRLSSRVPNRGALALLRMNPPANQQTSQHQGRHSRRAQVQHEPRGACCSQAVVACVQLMSGV